MKSWILLCSVLVLGGCVGLYRPAPPEVGHFVAPGGESLDIQSDGWIYSTADEKKALVGIARVEREAPLTIQVVGPDSSRWLGTLIVFSADRRSLTVDWKNLRKTGTVRASAFEKQGVR